MLIICSDYGTLPYEAQPAGFTPEAISAGQHGKKENVKTMKY